MKNNEYFPYHKLSYKDTKTIDFINQFFEIEWNLNNNGSRTKINKLLFYIHIVYYKYNGTKLTQLQFIRNDQGAYSLNKDDIFLSISKKEISDLEIMDMESVMIDLLTKEVYNDVKTIYIENIKDKYASIIVGKQHRLSVFQSTPFGEVIDYTKFSSESVLDIIDEKADHLIIDDISKKLYEKRLNNAI